MREKCFGKIQHRLCEVAFFRAGSESDGRRGSDHRQGQQTGRQGRSDRDTRQETHAGSAKGQIWMAPDFDATPEDFKDYR
jgi:hypothetical protein